MLTTEYTKPAAETLKALRARLKKLEKLQAQDARDLGSTVLGEGLSPRVRARLASSASAWLSLRKKILALERKRRAERTAPGATP
ncbi:MAG: hypothetical protein IT371_09935 [Deltaproteobacteria bacterium]|nr:hypothetical protein [Deltaproteobacteria bacterium]